MNNFLMRLLLPGVYGDATLIYWKSHVEAANIHSIEYSADMGRISFKYSRNVFGIDLTAEFKGQINHRSGCGIVQGNWDNGFTSGSGKFSYLPHKDALVGDWKLLSPEIPPQLEETANSLGCFPRQQGDWQIRFLKM